MSGETFPPRFLRIGQACFYLALNKDYFNHVVRPHLTEIRVGEIGVRFDRLELDDWAEDHKSRNGRLPQKGDETCNEKMSKDSAFEVESGISKKSSKDTENFVKALTKATSKKRKVTCTDV